MPNWVYNSLVVSGDKSELEKMVAQLNKPFDKHFPDTKWNDETKSWDNTPAVQHYSNPVFAFWNIIAPTNLEAYYGEEKKIADSDALSMIAKIELGFQTGMDWYNWNVRNWGTKWDVAVSDDSKYSNTTMEWTDDDSVMYHFETAWSPVFEALIKLSEMFPSLEFDYEYEEEQGWGGKVFISDGQHTVEEEYDIPESHADYVARGKEDSCVCNWFDDEDEVFEDCPKTSENTLDNAPSI
jgi:hypothetical protein